MMLKFEEIGDVETDAAGDMLPGIYGISGVGLIIVGEKKETVIIRHWTQNKPVVFNRSRDDLKPWSGSMRLKLVEVAD